MSSIKKKPTEGGATFPFSHRLFRFFWTLIWGLLGKWTPTPFHAWRRAIVRLFGGKISPLAKIYPGVDIWYPPNLEMAEFSCLGPRSICYCMGQVMLDRYALVSQGAQLCGGSHDVDDPDFKLYVGDIYIGERAWVAADAFVGPGVVLQEGAVLGARGVAFKNLDAWSVYVGSPAKRLRNRNHVK